MPQAQAGSWSCPHLASNMKTWWCGSVSGTDESMLSPQIAAYAWLIRSEWKLVIEWHAFSLRHQVHLGRRLRQRATVKMIPRCFDCAMELPTFRGFDHSSGYRVEAA